METNEKILHKRLLEMAKAFHHICIDNNLHYYMLGGTMLGAIRHKGFIPWDDDMDIVLLRKDYKKLEKILCNMESEEFVFHCMKTDVDYVNCFGKFRARNGSVQSKNKRNSYYKWKGIGFDIFSIEKTNFIATRLASLIYHKTQRVTVNIKNEWIRKSLIRIIECINFGLIFPILRIIGAINPKNEYHYTLGTGWPSHIFYMEDTFPLSKTEFEGIMLPVPHDVDRYLTNVYGDWRTPPSEEQIKASIHCQEYRDEIFGKGN